jgi:hypothetical protein
VLGFISFLYLGIGVVEGLFARWFGILMRLFALKKDGGFSQLQ